MPLEGGSQEIGTTEEEADIFLAVCARFAPVYFQHAIRDFAVLDRDIDQGHDFMLAQEFRVPELLLLSKVGDMDRFSSAKGTAGRRSHIARQAGTTDDAFLPPAPAPNHELVDIGPVLEDLFLGPARKSCV